MTVNRKSLHGGNKEAPRREVSAKKGIERWEDEGGSLPAADSDGSDLKASTLADNAGWRADLPTASGSK